MPKKNENQNCETEKNPEIQQEAELSDEQMDHVNGANGVTLYNGKFYKCDELFVFLSDFQAHLQDNDAQNCPKYAPGRGDRPGTCWDCWSFHEAPPIPC